MRIGDLTLAVRSRSQSLRLSVPAASRPFLVDGMEADLTLEARSADLATRSRTDLAFDSGGVWRLYRCDGRDVFQFFDRRSPSRPYKEASIEADGATGELLLDPSAWTAGEPAEALEYPLDELLFVRLLAARGALEMHACGVVMPSGQGCLFTGHSGDGKTTTARLWQEVPGASILSDDRIVLRRDASGAWRMHGTPWHGEAELAANASAPLAAVFVLARGDRPRFQPLERAAAVSVLFARSFVPLHDATAVGTTLAALEHLVEAVSCRTFAFTPGPEAIRFVQCSFPG